MPRESQNCARSEEERYKHGSCTVLIKVNIPHSVQCAGSVGVKALKQREQVQVLTDSTEY